MVGVAAVNIVDERLGPPPPPGKTKLFVYGLTTMAVIGGFLFGYDTGVVAGAMVVIKEDWGPDEITELWQELIVSVTVGAAAIAALFGAPLNDRFGRKPVILLSSALFTVGAVIMAFAPNKEALLGGRIVVGAAIGLSSMSIPAYVAEVCPPDVRGRLITMFQLMITFGFWIAGLLNGGFSYLPVNISWRFMLGVAGVPALVQLIGFFFMPESPRWLATHEKNEEALKVLRKVSSTPAISEWEMKAIRLSHQEEEEARELKGGETPFVAMVTSGAMRRALLVGCCLQMFQQLCGINTVMYYSTTIIQMAGIKDTHEAIWLTSVVSGFNFFCTFLGLYLVEKLGRRKLVLISTAGVIICLLLLGVGFYLIASDSPVALTKLPLDDEQRSDGLKGCSYNGGYLSVGCDACSYNDECGFCMTKEAVNGSIQGVCMRSNPKTTIYSTNNSRCSETELDDASMQFAFGWCPSRFAALPIIAMVVYLCCFSCGLGPMPWTINAEIYPLYVRSIGVSIATSTNWFFNLIISLTFLTLARAATRQGAFFIYAGISFIGLVLFYLIVPETKNKNLEELATLFEKPWFGKEKSQVSPRTSNYKDISSTDVIIKRSPYVIERPAGVGKKYDSFQETKKNGQTDDDEFNCKL